MRETSKNLAFVILLLTASCGGESGVPGGDFFGTVSLITNVEKTSVQIDLADLYLSDNVCLRTVSISDDEYQSITFRTATKQTNVNFPPSSIYIYNSSLRFYTTEPNKEPMNTCIIRNVIHPSISIEVPANGSITVSIPIISQAAKNCLVEKYSEPDQNCKQLKLDFGDGKTEYTVYPILSYKAKEVQTGIEKSFEINLGPVKLSDVVRQTTGGQQ